MFKKHRNSKRNKGFTLIELLVVVAIIGILSGVVLASLNSAREKGKIGAIKSTLKNMQSQAEITYNETGSYASLFGSSNFDCIGPLANMAQSLTDKGVTVKCYSANIPSNNDVYLRFGATALIYDTNELKAWSTDQNGVVKWDISNLNATNLPGGNTKTWSQASIACTNNEGRLPSVEQIKNLSIVWYYASLASTGTGSYTPTPVTGGLNASTYWFSTVNPLDNSHSYIVDMTNSGIYSISTATTTRYVRCVR